MNSTSGTGVFSRGGIFSPAAPGNNSSAPDADSGRHGNLPAPTLVARYIIGRLGGIAAELDRPADVTLDLHPLERAAGNIGVSVDILPRVSEFFADHRLIENHRGRIIVTNLAGIRRLAADHH
jgi:hypothetical protein